MPNPGPASGHLAYRIACVLVLLGWAALFGHVLANPGAFQWDLKSYYAASHVYTSGGDPYDVQNLRRVGGGARILPFYYPLSGLHVLRPICSLDYRTAYKLWAILEAAAIAALLLIWKRWFLERTDWLWILVLGLLGFGGAVLWDIKAGNVAAFEQLLVWAGFAFLLRARVSAFVACVVAASVFKMIPAVFLLLLLLPALRSRTNVLKMAAGLVAVAVIVLLPFAGKPELFASFARGLRGTAPPLQYNPTFFGAFDEMANAYGLGWFGGPVKYVFLLVYAAALLFASRRLVRAALASGSLRFAILVAVMLYALLMPKFVIYSYMIVFVPVLALVFPLLARSKAAAYAALAALSLGGIAAIPTNLGTFLGHWSPFLLLVGSWAVLVAAERSGALAKVSSQT